ncbi:MAG TPA: hypothetical protein VNA26_08320, partial [Chitinophagaceae bacterium]|nr:hypothetical protein [Chitinophagaceae bacterium]
MKQIHFLCFFFAVLIITPYKSFTQSRTDITQTGRIKELSRLYIDQVLNNKNIKLLDTIFAEKYVFHEMNGTKSSHMKNKTLAPYLLYLFS